MIQTFSARLTSSLNRSSNALARWFATSIPTLTFPSPPNSRRSGESLPSQRSLPGRGVAGDVRFGLPFQKYGQRIQLPWPPRISIILHTITLQTIVYMSQSYANAKVAWTNIPEEVRDTLFRVWTDARELLWAEKCWGTSTSADSLPIPMRSQSFGFCSD
jgi:hypothetical protein